MSHPNGPPGPSRTPLFILRPEIIDIICNTFSVDKGSIAMACARAGIHESSYENYMRRGRDKQEPYTQFYDAVKKARAVMEGGYLETLRELGFNGEKPDWKSAAWLLQKQFPQGYKDSIDVNLDEQPDEDLSCLSDEELNEYERLEAKIKAANGGDG